MLESLIAGAIALALNSSGLPPVTFVPNPYIEKISCDGGSGTGFKLANGTWVSVWHVTRMEGCKIDGLPIILTHSDPHGDFSTFIVPGDNRRGGLKANCGGYRDGQWVHAQGHARGHPVIQSMPLMYSDAVQSLGFGRGWSVLVYNSVIPGQSGGPVLNGQGEVVGTVNAYNPFWPISFSRSLSRTILCA
jgi:hypothetical protein